MKPIDFRRIARAVGAVETPACMDGFAAGVSTDSRSVKCGDLFFALRGERFDGHNFVPRAIGLGASAAVVNERSLERMPEWCRGKLFVVDETRKALLRLAAEYRSSLKTTVICVTGSCGKTTTKDLLHAALSAGMNGIASRESFNNDVGVPLTLFDIEDSHDFAVVEIGANAPGEIAELAAVAAPRIGLITCIRPVHLEGFKSLDGVARAKSELVDALPADGVFAFNPEEHGMLRTASRFGGALLTFGTLPCCTMRMEGVETGRNSIRLSVRGTRFKVPLLGRHNAMNVTAAISVGWLMGVGIESMAEALKSFDGPKARMKMKDLGDVTMIDDAYNANPASVMSAIAVLAEMESPGRKVLVLGDMMELGTRALDFHRSVGRAAADMNPDLTVSVGPLSCAATSTMVARGVPQSRVMHFDDTSDAAIHIASILRSGDVVLLKASRKMSFEKIREAIERKWSASRRLEAAEKKA